MQNPMHHEIHLEKNKTTARKKNEPPLDLIRKIQSDVRAGASAQVRCHLLDLAAPVGVATWPVSILPWSEAMAFRLRREPLEFCRRMEDESAAASLGRIPMSSQCTQAAPVESWKFPFAPPRRDPVLAGAYRKSSESFQAAFSLPLRLFRRTQRTRLDRSLPCTCIGVQGNRLRAPHRA